MLKRDIQLHLVMGGLKYKLPIYEDFSMSQVYSEVQLNNKTLHNPEKLITTTLVSYLNSGNVSFTVPVINTVVAKAVFSHFMKTTPLTLYVTTETSVTKLNSVVIENLIFNTTRNSIITASISGTYSHSEKVTSVPGTNVPDNNPVYTYVQGLGLSFNNVTENYINNFTIELSNSVQWVNRNFMQDQIPSHGVDFVITERNLSGNYSKQKDLDIPQYGTSSMDITIKSEGDEFLKFVFPSVTFTTRAQVDTILKEGVDFKINENVLNQVLYKGENIL